MDEKVLTDHMVEEENRLTKIETKLENLETEFKELKTSISNLVAAWETAGNLVTFVKWISGIVLAISAAIVAIKTGFFK